MPIISTDVGDISSVVKDRLNGVFITPGDIGALADGIISVSSQKAFSIMSKASRQMIEDSFSIESFYVRLKKLYRNLCETDG